MRGEIGSIICWSTFRGQVLFGEIIEITPGLNVRVQQIYKMSKGAVQQRWLYLSKKRLVRTGQYWTLPFDKALFDNPQDRILRKPAEVLELSSCPA